MPGRAPGLAASSFAFCSALITATKAASLGCLVALLPSSRAAGVAVPLVPDAVVGAGVATAAAAAAAPAPPTACGGGAAGVGRGALPLLLPDAALGCGVGVAAAAAAPAPPTACGGGAAGVGRGALPLLPPDAALGCGVGGAATVLPTEAATGGFAAGALMPCLPTFGTFFVILAGALGACSAGPCLAAEPSTLPGGGGASLLLPSASAPAFFPKPNRKAPGADVRSKSSPSHSCHSFFNSAMPP